MGHLPCQGICQLVEDTRPVSNKTGRLPRCMECRFSYSEDTGQLRCPCCNSQMRRSRR